MRTTVWLVAALTCLLSFSLDAAAQRRKLEQLETRIGNLQTDLEVLQEFIQEQSTGLQKLKTRTDELDKLKESIGKVEQQARGLADLVSKNSGSIAELSLKVREGEERIGKIEEALARKRVDFSGQLRIRPEFKTNYRTLNFMLDEDQNFGASHRARIAMDVAPLDTVKARITLQDARTWGSPTLFVQSAEMGGTGFEDRNRDSALRVHEAFIDLDIVAEMLHLRAGRQIWNFGAGRMIGDNDWEQAGRSFDGLDLTLTYEKYVKADLLFSWIDERNALVGSDVLFGGLYVNVPYVKDLDLEAYFLYLGDDRDNAKRNVGTLGARVAGKLPWHAALFFDLEGAIQFGTVTEQGANDTGPIDNSLYAVFLHADIGYDIPVETSPAIALFVEVASGDNSTSPLDTGNDQAVAWIPLFPTRHSLFGPMDMWNQTNLWDFGAKASLTPVKGLEIGLQLHLLRRYAEAGALPWGGEASTSYQTGLEQGLGTEFDLLARYELNENLAFSGGYGLFSPNKTFFEELDELAPVIINDEETGEPYRYPRGDSAHWAYVQADFTF
jgi:hypothetical protein